MDNRTMTTASFPETCKPNFVESKENIPSEHVAASVRDTAEVEAYRQKNNIIVPVPNPIQSFDEMKDIPAIPDMLNNQDHHDVQRICRQQVHILKESECRMKYTLELIRTIQSSSSTKILIFTVLKEDSISLAKYLKEEGVTVGLFNDDFGQEEVLLRIEEFRNGTITCLITMDSTVQALTDGIEHVIHFSYASSSYGKRLSHMSYSRTGGTSHVILSDTEHDAAKSMIDQMKYGNQEITAELLELANLEAGHVKKVRSNEEIRTTLVEVSDKSDDQPLEVLPQSIITVPTIRMDDNSTTDSNISKIENNSTEPSTSTTSGDGDTRNLFPTTTGLFAGKSENLFHIPTDQFRWNFKDRAASIFCTTTEVEASNSTASGDDDARNLLLTTTGLFAEKSENLFNIPTNQFHLNFKERAAAMFRTTTEVEASNSTASGDADARNLFPTATGLFAGNSEIFVNIPTNQFHWDYNNHTAAIVRTTTEVEASTSTASGDDDARNSEIFVNISAIQHPYNFAKCKKDIYSDHVDAIVRTTSEVEAYRQKYNILVSGDIVAPNPIQRFDEMKDIRLLPHILRMQGHPSPMQSQAWPIILSGHDMIGLTRNGQERTLAYLLPAVLHIRNQTQIQPNEGPIVLILTQSTELARNLSRIVDKFCGKIGIRKVLVTIEKHKYKRYIEKGIDMVIGVPNITLIMLKRNEMNLKFCSMVIVDDVDAQMAVKNGQVLREVLKYAPAGRQILWFSQSWFAAAQQFAIEHMPNGYCSVDVGKFHRDVHRICRQQVYILKESECRMIYTLELIRTIQSSSSTKILIFAALKKDSISLAQYLKEGGIKAGSVYHSEVQDLIEEFRNGNTTCLITLDSSVQPFPDDIEHVIHFSYNSATYGKRLSHMSYSSTGGTSHVILNVTEQEAAKSMVEHLKYGNQVLAAKSMIEQLKSGNREIAAELLLQAQQYHCNFIEYTKDIYSDHVDAIVRTTTEVEAYRQKYDILVSGDILAPNPIQSFDEMKDIPVLPNLLMMQGHPSPLQSQAWPIILSGHDMIGLTRNGHERTLAYLLPAVLHILKQTQIQPAEGPIVLILSQFGELCMNILQLVDLFRYEKPIRTTLLIVEKNRYERRTKKGIDMVIAVPEIALRMLKRNAMNLKCCSMVIVDDVDAATHGEVLRDILKYAPVGRQILWFSQSWFDVAQQLAVEHMPNGFCSVDARKFHLNIHRICSQQVYILKKTQCKMLHTLKLICEIQSKSTDRILVFTARTDKTKKLVSFLQRGGVMAESFNGNVSSGEVQRHMESLRTGRISCLVTMDSNFEACLADDFEHVIHFSYNSSSYAKRLRHMSFSLRGGTSHVILNDTEHDAAKSMIEQLKYGNQKIPAELVKLANPKAGNVKKVQPNAKIRTTLVEVSDKSDDQPLEVLPQSTITSPTIRMNDNSTTESNISKHQDNSIKPSSSTASSDVDTRNLLPATTRLFAEMSQNLDSIPTKNFIECTKDIYDDHVAAPARTTIEVERYRKLYDIRVGGDILAPNPITSFDELKDIPSLPHLLRVRGRPNPMESQAWPIILSGRDMIGLTRNGHERTLAYLLPAILHINKQTQIQPNEGPIVLILTPSKEPSTNILQAVDLFCTKKRLRRALIGNDEHKLNQRYIRKGVDMVIAVAENALTTLKRNIMNLNFCSMVIVDDVDAQMDATYREVLRDILKYAPDGRQTLWFSQFWCAAAQQFAIEHMPNGYCSVDVGKFHRDVQRICKQQVYILKESECRMKYTLELIRTIQCSPLVKILIFTVLKDDSIRLAKYLKEAGITAGSLNDVVNQEEKIDLITEFKNGTKTCLITMDSTMQALADGIEHVIHFGYASSSYGMRLSHMSYSKTGGTSHVILNDTEQEAAKSMIEQLKYGNQMISAALIQQAIGAENELSKEEVRSPIVEVKSKTQPLKVVSLNKIQVILTTDLNRQTIRDNSAKTVKSNKISNSKIDAMPSTSAVAGANKRIQIVKETEQISDAKKQKIESITQPLSTDRWIGANDILRRILIEDAKNKKSLSTNTALHVHSTNTISTVSTLSSGMCIPLIYTRTTARSTTSSPGNSFKGTSENDITSTTTVKRFRSEDLYGVSDDSE